MNYTVVSTSKCLYQEWQIKLLNWSRKNVGQEGKLLILLSEDINHSSEIVDFNLTADPDILIYHLPDWAKEWQNANGEWWGGIPNKYEAVKWLTENLQFEPGDIFLFVDPDMVFTEKVEFKVSDSEIIGQKWRHFTRPDSEYPEGADGVMYPFLINFYTLKKIVDDYKQACINFRKTTERWESEMYGLDYAVKVNNLNITAKEDLGFCTLWMNNDSKLKSSLIHFPNPIEDKEKSVLFFKQDYTTNLNQKIEISKARNLLDTILLSNVDQQRTNYRYYTELYTKDLFKFYTGEDGYFLYEKWPGGFNNIRMSLELAVCISFITNRTLVLPPDSSYYLLEDVCGLEDFFDCSNLGVKHLTYREFQKIERIHHSFEKVRDICKVYKHETSACMINFEKISAPQKVLKQRSHIKVDEIFTSEDKYVFFDKNLLGNFYQVIYSKETEKLKSLIGKHVRYKNEIFDIAWCFINELVDKDYYAIHIRRNDFQYKDLFISPEEMLSNIQDVVPEGAKLYIATDHKEEEFFNIFKSKYQVYFYKDIASKFSYFDYNPNWIPIFEQLICTRAKTFIGNKNSTLSSYIYRLRGYMNDIQDKTFHINTEKYSPENQKYFSEDNNYSASWAREYKDVWEFDTSKIFVSIASYCDSEIFNTLESLYSNVSDDNRVTVCVNLQDIEENYNKLLSYGYNNLKIIFTPKDEAKGVVVARNRIKDQIQGEPYFLQVDSHSRFKKNWDLILINQYNSIERDKVILTTYPNHYDVPDREKKHLSLEYNSPIKIKGFLISSDPKDNRCHAHNTRSLEDFEIADIKWCAAGFLFTRSNWANEVRLPDNIRFNGEEDFQTFISYLRGWNLMCASEACIWHNYNNKNIETDTLYKQTNTDYLIEDHSVSLLNEALFNQNYERTVEQLEDYFEIKLRR